MTLDEFLLARIAEDEARARRFHPDESLHVHFSGDDGPTVLYTAARVLAECEAKRRIVELRYSWNLQAESAPEPPFGPILKTQVVTADTILRTLASVYADHPDYDPSWRA